MKKRLPLLLPAFAVLALAVFFANIFITYAQPESDLGTEDALLQKLIEKLA